MTFQVVGLVNFPMADFNNSYFLLPFDTMQDFIRMPEATLWKNQGDLYGMTGIRAQIYNFIGNYSAPHDKWIISKSFVKRFHCTYIIFTRRGNITANTAECLCAGVVSETA
jgi:hypothetical protein